jgi:general stress protein 26
LTSVSTTTASDESSSLLTYSIRYKEKNKDEPGLEQKIERLVSFVKTSKFGMMTTRIADSGLLVSRCMAVAAQVCYLHFRRLPSLMVLQESGGVDFIFHTNNESGKTDDLQSDSHVNLAFLDSAGSWASISGTASVITDRSVVTKYYTPALKTWVGDLGDGKHDGSENDPRIGVIKVKAVTATYAIADGTAIGRGIEMVSWSPLFSKFASPAPTLNYIELNTDTCLQVKGAVTGEAAQVNKLREINEQEISQWRSSH